MKRYTLLLQNETRNTFDSYTNAYLDEYRAYNALIRKARRAGKMSKGDVFNATVVQRDIDFDGMHYGKPVKYVRKVY